MGFHFWIHPKEVKAVTQTGYSTPMCVAALFTIGEGWTQPQCHQWRNSLIKACIYIHRILFNVKKEGHFDPCYKVDEP